MNRSKDDSYSYYSEDNMENFEPIYDPLSLAVDFLYEDDNYIYSFKNKPLSNKNEIRRFSKSDKNFEQIFLLDSTYNFGIRLIEFENKLIGIYDKQYKSDSVVTILFKTDKEWKNYNELFEFDFSSQVFPGQINNIDGDVVFELMVKDESAMLGFRYDHFSLGSDLKNFTKINDSYLDSIYLPSKQNFRMGLNISQDDTVILRTNNLTTFQLVKIKLNKEKNNFVFEIIDTVQRDLIFAKSIKEDISYFYKQLDNIWIPISNDRKITSVKSKIEGPPVLWLYPPYPNPVKDRLRMRFYSSLIQNIQNLEVQLINIGSGKLYNIYNYDYIPENGFFGFLEFNIAGYLPGAYILNLKLAAESKSELIIIE